MKQAYYVDINHLEDTDAMIIDEATMIAAERGENYLNPDDFIFHGEFRSAEEARQAHLNDRWGARFAERYHP